MERVYADRDNHSALGVRPVRNSAERPEDRARQRNRNGAQLVMQEHRNAVQRNAAIAPHIAWQQRALMNFPNWQAQPYTRKELLILKTLKGSLFVYVVASLLNPIASGSDLTILYLILPSITGMFTMYALVCEQMAYLVPFLLALTFSTFESTVILFVTLQLRFVAPSNQSVLTRFLVRRFPGRAKALTKMVQDYFWSTFAFQLIFILFYGLMYFVVFASMCVFKRRSERAMQLEAIRQAQIERLNQHFVDVAMAAANNAEAVVIPDDVAADEDIRGAVNEDNPPSYKTAMKGIVDEDSPPGYSLFENDARFAHFHSNSYSTSPTTNYSQSFSSRGPQMTALPASATTQPDPTTPAEDGTTPGQSATDTTEIESTSENNNKRCSA